MGSHTAGIATMVGSLASTAGGMFSGAQGGSAYKREAKAIEEQSRLAFEDQYRLSVQRAREVRQFASQQEMTYAKSGVTLEGSPLLVIEETRRLGQEEIDATYNRGRAVYRLGMQQASQVRNQGRGMMLAGLSRGLLSMGATGLGIKNRAGMSRFGSVAPTAAGTQADPLAQDFIPLRGNY
jgi:hypothetical protein